MQIYAFLISALIFISKSIHLSRQGELSHMSLTSKFPCCPETYVFDEETLTCVCPLSMPYVDIAGKCISCLSPYYFDYNASLCTSCPNIKVFDSILKTCVCPYKFYNDETDHCMPCVDPQYWHQNSSRCLRCPNGFYVDPETLKCQCPASKPYLSMNNTCISCETGYDNQTFGCVKCIDQISFHGLLILNNNISIDFTFQMVLPDSKLVNFVCFQIQNISKKVVGGQIELIEAAVKKLKAESLLFVCPKPDYWDPVTLKCLRCPVDFQINPKTLKCQCSQSKPYLSINNTCISCETVFDEAVLQCVKCGNGTIWSKEEKACSCPEDSYLAFNDTCISCGTLFDEEKLNCIECSKGEVWNVTSKLCVCPPQKKFRSLNGSCVACPKPDFWDSKDYKCLRCPSGFEVNPETLKCQCPLSKPYLSINKACVSCETLFDEENLSCIQCLKGEVWNATSKSCVCPPEKNFTSADGSCVACPKPDFWNSATLKCLRCPAGFEIDPNTLKCECPKSNPYLSVNNTCVSCDPPSSWDYALQQCQHSTFK